MTYYILLQGTALWLQLNIGPYRCPQTRNPIKLEVSESFDHVEGSYNSDIFIGTQVFPDYIYCS